MSPKQKSFLRNPWSNHLPFQQPTLPPVTTHHLSVVMPIVELARKTKSSIGSCISAFFLLSVQARLAMSTPATTKMSLRVSDQSPPGPQRFIAPLTPIIFQMPASKGCKGLRACPLRPALLNWAPTRALCPEAP